MSAACAAAVVAFLGRAAPATLAASVSRPPAQFTSSTATPRLVIWTPTPDLRATERATSAAGTAQATLIAAPTLSTPPAGGSPAPGGGAGGPGTGGSGTPGPALGGSGLGTDVPPPGQGQGGVPPGAPGAPVSGGRPPPAGVGAGAGVSTGESGLVSAAGFPYRRAAPWLPPVADGVIAELWARYGSPMEGSWASRLTGEALGARRPGVFGQIWFYVAVVALLLGSATWLLVETRRVAHVPPDDLENTEPPREE